MTRGKPEVRIPEHVMARVIGDEVVILDLANGTYFGLDRVGARAWQLWSEKRSFDEVCQSLLNEFDVGRTELEQDLSKLVDELRQQGLLQIEPDADDPAH